MIINESLWIMTKFTFNKPKVHRLVKRMLEDYQGALEDIDKANVLDLNNASTLRSGADVKYMLDDNQGALKDFDKADFLNQTMHPP
jgi:tetratricopeptide (TPR) repeat protein